MKVGTCIVSPMKKIVAVGHDHETLSSTASADLVDLRRDMKGASLDFGKD